MSFDHWWYSCLLTPEQEQLLGPQFESAAKTAAATPVDEEALSYMREHPDWIRAERELGNSIDGIQAYGRWYSRYIWTFNRPGFLDFGVDMVTKHLNRDTCFRFIMIRRCTPGAILWQALGPDRADMLPGRMGNLFVPAASVDVALSSATASIRGLDLGTAIHRGLELAGHSNDEHDVRDVITHLPEGLQRARELRCGFMAISHQRL